MDQVLVESILVEFGSTRFMHMDIQVGKSLSLQILFIADLAALVQSIYQEYKRSIIESESELPEIAPLLNTVREGLMQSQRPEPVPCGVNGTYFMKDKDGSKVAIFKPADEEFCGYDGTGVDGAASLSEEFGLLPGETVFREAAAYRITQEHPDSSLQNVPPTCLVHITSPRSLFLSQPLPEGEVDAPITKFGSLQAFVDADGDSEEFGSSRFSTEDVHRIGVLDLQILNCDRNPQNILVKRKSDVLSLIPIDHGFSMPASLSLGAGRFEWLNYPASRKPFSSRLLAYIEAIDLERLVTVLRREFKIREPCLDAIRISNTFLKLGAASGLSLYDIGDAVCRRDLDEPSDLELALLAAKAETSESDPAFQDVLLGKIQDLVTRITSDHDAL